MPDASPQPTRILVAEDDADLSALLRLHLTDAGFAVTTAADGALALQHALSGEFDLLVLDWMMPGMSGIEVCERLRASARTLPILMLTARGSEADRIQGLETGADDYVAKPFSVREVVARVRALLRRVQLEHPEDPADEVLTFGVLVVKPAMRQVEIGGEPVELTAKELQLLTLFARQPGKTFTRQELLDQVWGYQYAGYAHTVNTHINRLRGKIEPDPAEPSFVQTVWGIGYRFGSAQGHVGADPDVRPSADA